MEAIIVQEGKNLSRLPIFTQPNSKESQSTDFSHSKIMARIIGKYIENGILSQDNPYFKMIHMLSVFKEVCKFYQQNQIEAALDVRHCNNEENHEIQIISYEGREYWRLCIVFLYSRLNISNLWWDLIFIWIIFRYYLHLSIDLVADLQNHQETQSRNPLRQESHEHQRQETETMGSGSLQFLHRHAAQIDGWAFKVLSFD